jgi:multidrug efflux pump
VTVIALVLSWLVSVYFVPYLGTLLLKAAAPCGGRGRGAAPSCSTALLQHVSSPGELVRAAPLDHHWRHLGDLCAGHCGHGRCSSSSSPIPAGPRFWWTSGIPEGTSFAANEEVTKRVEERLMAGAGRADGQHLGGLGRAALLPAAGPGVPQTNVSQFIIVPKDLKVREALRIKLPA